MALVTGGSSGIGLATAHEFADLGVAELVLVARGEEKLERARELGAWKTINYRETPDWGREAKKLAGGDGVDLVVEVGGAGTLEQSLRAVRGGGQG